MTCPALLAGLILWLTTTATGQVHYHPDGRPWSQRAHDGPDKGVPGWFYNLGITGLRVELVEDAKTHLVVRHVFDRSPAAGRVRPGDHIVGAAGRPFATPHRNGYGMKVFGPEGPILDFARALERALGGDGRLKLSILRGKARRPVILPLGKRHGTFGKTFPDHCAKSERLLAGLLAWLVEQQRDDGSWGSPPHDLFAPLALLANGEQKYREPLRRCARFHARTTKAKDHSSLINWRYMAAAIFLSEYYLATGERWILPELSEIRDFLVHSQYMDLAQLDPKVHQTHPHAVPKNAEDAHGGWGHNPGFEGYGPIAMITGQGAMAFALMRHCGIEIDRSRHDAAYAFLARATGRNGYVWYEDQVADHKGYADMGRTGAAGLANALAPYPDPVHRRRALEHARCIGDHPLSFPDTHGCPTMGMALAAMAAHVDPRSFRSLMNANRWWFTLAECGDGTFYYQPNRDNAGYGRDSRLSASAVTALILSIPHRSLHVTGKPFGRQQPGDGR